MRSSVLLLLFMAAATCLAAPFPRIRVRIYDYTTISPVDLERATSEATKRLAEAGITSEWVACRFHKRPTTDPRCDKPFTPSDFVMNILPRGMAARLKQPANALAFTAIGESADNWEFWIFYDSVRALGEHDAGTATILGDVMAHELGHLLEASDAHGKAGLMLASWSSQQFDDVAHGRFHFSPEAGAAIRDGFDRRWDAQDDQAAAVVKQARFPQTGP